MSNGGQEHIVQAGEWLSKLAKQFYDDSSLWRAIWHATNAKSADDPSFTYIEDPNLIQPGQKLWIPSHDEAKEWVDGPDPEDDTIPPDPKEIAPELDQTVATDLATATEFLYTGETPIQTGVAPETINPMRVAVIRGQVLDREDKPLPGVTVNILNHPELGQTRSRADGMFDLAVNGGGLLTVNYTKADYLPAQRQVFAPWRDYVWASDVVMVALDPIATTVDLSQTDDDFVVAQASEVEDDDGQRRATLLFPKGTQAEMALPDGTTQPLTSMTVRATEYTVGKNGPQAMPAMLPPATGYTYAVEFSVDEALAAEAGEVRFDQPLNFYLEDFIGFPVGSPVPTGYYDREKGRWIALENGRVIKILGITNGLADVDADGDGEVEDTTELVDLGITEAERQKLAALYPYPPQQLWRVPINHFSTVDCNWPFGPPRDASDPGQSDPRSGVAGNESCEVPGSVIETQNQILGESVSLSGTPFALHYRSGGCADRQSNLTVNIPLSSSDIPSSLKRIELEIRVAGQRFNRQFPAEPNQSDSFTWNGKDAYGRDLQGEQTVLVRIGYTYDGVYGEAERFGAFLSKNIPITGSRTRQEVTLWQERQVEIGAFATKGLRVGGWSLNAQHHISGRRLYLGDGSRRTVNPINGYVLKKVAGKFLPGSNYSGDGGPATEADIGSDVTIAIGADNSIYIADSSSSRIRRVDPDGIITTIAGTGGQGAVGYENYEDGGLAINTDIGAPKNIVVGADENIYFIHSIGPYYFISKIDLNGVIHTLLKDNRQLADLTVGADGTIYFIDQRYLRCLDTDGEITTLFDTNTSRYTRNAIALGIDGCIYFSYGRTRISRRDPDGHIDIIAGTGVRGDSGDGGQATNAQLSVVALGASPDGSLYFTQPMVVNREKVRRISPRGIINTVITSGSGGADDSDSNIVTVVEEGQVKHVNVNPSEIAFDREGNLYFSTSRLVSYIIKVVPSTAAELGEKLFPSKNGNEIYVFSHSGRHVRTFDALSQATLYSFNYNDNGTLNQIIDESGNTTTIERDEDGQATAIVAPFGQRTELLSNENGYLEKISDPAEQTYSFTYHDAGGLLAMVTDPRGNTSSYTYDDLGRLITANDPARGKKDLIRTGSYDDYTVRLITGLLRETAYRVKHLPSGETHWETTCCGGSKTVMETKPDGSRIMTDADGTVTTLQQGPDPRFGMEAPIIEAMTTETPGGLEATLKMARETKGNPADPFDLERQTDTITLNGRARTSVIEMATPPTVTITSPTGRQTVTTLDEQGRVVEETLPGLEPVTYTYDAHGRLATLAQGADVERRVVSLSYDAAGNLDAMTDPLHRAVRFTYDAAGRVKKQTLPDGREISYSYDENGNLTSLTPPDRPAHMFEYNEVNLETDYDPPEVGAGTNRTTYTYNKDRQPTKITRPDGQTIDLSYDDAAGRLSAIQIPRGMFQYDYNPTSGNLTGITAPDGGTLTFSYDGSLSLGAVWQGLINGSVTQTYDNNFRVIKRQINESSPVDFGFDEDGLLTQAGRLTLDRDTQNGLLNGTTLEDVTDSYGYNRFGELADYRAGYDGTEKLAVTYARDKLGRITSKTETLDGHITTIGYGYDTAGRLETVTKNGETIATYTYDDNGNRLSYTGPEGSFEGQYDDQDRLLQYGETTYQYTANGELQRKTNPATNETTTYHYDVLGNLIQVNLPDGTEIEYLIDGLNRRIGKKVNGALMQGFLYKDQLNPIAELDGSGQVVARFIYGSKTNIPDYIEKTGQIYRIISDHLGSPRLVIDITSGHVVQQLDYDAFGQVLSDTNPGFQPFGFAGGIYDKHTKLSRFGARDYDARVGRWTTKDPIGFDGRDLNLYLYAANDPVNINDPTGYIIWVAAIVVVMTVNIAGLVAAVHWGRNNWNERVSNIDDVSSWTELTPGESIFHRMGPGNEKNLKYVSPNGHSEAVFKPCKNGGESTLVTDPLNYGTYNFFGPRFLLGIPHGIFDILPYFVFGNSPSDMFNSHRFRALFNK